MSDVFEIPVTAVDVNARKALRDALRAARNSDAGAVLITLAGDEWTPADLAAGLTAAEIGREFHAALRTLFGLDRPVVAHLDGRVAGFGLGLALACDLRFCAPGSQLCVGPADQSMVAGLPWLLTHRAGTAVAGHLVWSGTELTPDDALRCGLASGVGDTEGARAEAHRLAALPRTVSSALKRSLVGRVQGELQGQLGYDSWLTLVAAGACR